VKTDALTPRAIERLPAGSKASDGALDTGDGRLIVRARRRRSGVVREFGFRWYDGDGADRLLIIGTIPELSLKSARDRARELQGVVAEGGDPRLHVERQQIAQERSEREKRASGSFSELLDAYVAWLKAEKKESAREVELSLKRHVTKAFPKLARRKASDIVTDDIVEVLAKMIRAGYKRKANMVRAYLHAAFAKALKSDNDPRRAAQNRSTFRLSSTPVANVPRQADFDRVGDRVLTDAELKAYWLALAEREDPIAAAMKVGLLLGGQRVAQLLRVTWADYDSEAGTLMLRDPKGRGGTRNHILPVSKRVAVLLPLPHPDGGEFIFTTGRKLAIHPSSIAVNAKAIADAIVKRGPSFSTGDIRRTAETRLAALGVSKELRAQVLSHGITRGVQEKHYDRHLYLTEKAGVLELWEKHLSAVVADAPTPSPAARGKARLQLVRAA
jgi:integrase